MGYDVWILYDALLSRARVVVVFAAPATNESSWKYGLWFLYLLWKQNLSTYSTA